MKTRFPNRYGFDSRFPRFAEFALTYTSKILEDQGGEGKLLKRNFAAVSIAARYDSDIREDTWRWEMFEQRLLCEAWIGSEQGYGSAQRDYLANARHKAFTSWRTGRTNGNVLLSTGPESLAPQDSLWPGAVCAGDLVLAVSGLTPWQDENLSSLILSLIAWQQHLEDMNNTYDGLYQPGYRDLVDGTNFNHPPLW